MHFITKEMHFGQEHAHACTPWRLPASIMFSVAVQNDSYLHHNNIIGVEYLRQMYYTRE